MNYIKTIWFFVLLFSFRGAAAQQCGNCKTTPSVALYDLDVQVPQPELKGEKTQAWLEWQQLFWLARHANSNLFQNNKNCIRFTQPPSYDDKGTEILKVGQTYVNIPAANTNISQYGNYLITGFVKKSGNGYVMHMELQTSCSRKTVASADVPFQLSAESTNTISIANQAASQLSPLIDKIKKFELEERNQNQKFAIAGNDIELIKITPAKTKLTAGQQTDFTMVLKGCDGVALPGREIVFTEGNAGGGKMPGTIGGTVTPAKVITDAQGKAKANFTMIATAGKPAVINAHTLTQTPQNCQGVLFGDAQIDALPAYKVTVSYIKTVRTDLNMNSNEDRVLMKGGSQSSEDVAYSFSLLHYLPTSPKEGEQIMIMPQFEDDPQYQKSKKGKTVVLYNTGYSEYIMTGTSLEMEGPFGAVTEKGKEEKQRYFSSSPLPPTASFIFKNNDLIYFSGGVEFPEVEDGLSPVSSSFGIEINDKKYFPLKPKRVTDPNSPYKWVYEFEYKNEEGYNKQGKVFKQGSKEVESATVQIWKTF